jgi:hypothetical protein
LPIDITKEEVYGKIKLDVDSALKEYRREYIPSRILVDLLDTWAEPEVELFLASYPETPSLVLERIAYTGKDPDVLCAIASHPRTAAKVMQDLASHKELEVRLMLAGNKQISPQTAALLSEDDSVLIRAELAKNPALPTRVQNHLLSDPSALVRSVFCDLKNIEIDHLQKLLMDPDHLVKARTAIMAKVTDEVLLKWADSDELYAQLFLISRKNLAPKVMESLSFSSHSEIQKRAISGKVLAEDEQLGWANGEDITLRKAVAAKEELTEKVQIILAQDSSVEVREILAQNLCTSLEAQEILAADPEGNVAGLLLDKEDLASSALNKLCENCDEDTAFELALTAELSDQQISILANKGSIELIFVLAKRELSTSLLTRERVVELVNSRMPTLIAFAIKSKCLKKGELSKFVAHPCEGVRLAVIENINVSEEILNKLHEDEKKSVSNAATTRMEELDFKINKEIENPKQGDE